MYTSSNARETRLAERRADTSESFAPDSNPITTRDHGESSAITMDHLHNTVTVSEVHELALMESVVERVIEQTAGARVVVVRLEIGRLSGVAVDALRFCFEVCTEGTTLAGSALEIREIGGRARCGACGSEREIDSFATPCACGSFEQQVLSGHELRLKEVEVI